MDIKRFRQNGKGGSLFLDPKFDYLKTMERINMEKPLNLRSQNKRLSKEYWIIAFILFALCAIVEILTQLIL